VVCACVSAAATWAIVTQVAGVHLGVRLPRSPATTVALGTTVAAAATATLLGWGVLAALEALTRRARKMWAILAAAVSTASLALPIAWATTTAAALGLVAVHLVVASVAITGFTRGTSPRAASPGVANTGPAGAGLPPAPAKGRRSYRGVRPLAALLVALAVVGGAVTGWAHRSFAGGPPVGQAGAMGPMSAPWPGGVVPWPSGPASASGPGRPGWGAGAARTEYFQVESTRPSGPGAIILTGVVDAGGTEHPGRAIDGATFAGGSFRIDHSRGRPTVAFDRRTCVGTIDESGTFSVLDGTGRFSALAGSGKYVFRATYTRAPGLGGCTGVMTAYLETIEAALTLSPSAARHLSAGQK
jgi:hypothetical protein